MTEQPSYAEYLALIRRQADGDRARFEGDPAASPSPYDLRSGHPLDQSLPPTGVEEYDSLQPRAQVHADAAIEAAGFDLRALDRYRAVLEADPYGPQFHRMLPDGRIEPVVSAG